MEMLTIQAAYVFVSINYGKSVDVTCFGSAEGLKSSLYVSRFLRVSHLYEETFRIFKSTNISTPQLTSGPLIIEGEQLSVLVAEQEHKLEMRGTRSDLLVKYGDFDIKETNVYERKSSFGGKVYAGLLQGVYLPKTGVVSTYVTTMPYSIHMSAKINPPTS